MKREWIKTYINNLQEIKIKFSTKNDIKDK